MTNGRWDIADKWINRILLLIGVIYFAWHVASKEDIKMLREDMNRQLSEIRSDIKTLEQDYKNHLTMHNLRASVGNNDRCSLLHMTGNYRLTIIVHHLIT